MARAMSERAQLFELTLNIHIICPDRTGLDCKRLGPVAAQQCNYRNSHQLQQTHIQNERGHIQFLRARIFGVCSMMCSFPGAAGGFSVFIFLSGAFAMRRRVLRFICIFICIVDRFTCEHAFAAHAIYVQGHTTTATEVRMRTDIVRSALVTHVKSTTRIASALFAISISARHVHAVEGIAGFLYRCQCCCCRCCCYFC